MFDRRKAQRFQLSEPADGHLRVLQDVDVEHVSEQDFTVLATTPCPRGEEIVLEVTSTDGELMTFAVTAVESEPVLVDGRVRHRLWLRVQGTENPLMGNAEVTG